MRTTFGIHTAYQAADMLATDTEALRNQAGLA